MASTITADNGVSSGSAGLKQTADSTGVLALRTTTAGGTATTALTISTSQVVDFVNTPTVNGTPIGGGGGGFSGATTNAVSSSAITLTSASTQYQVCQISSFTNSYVTLPDATTLTAGSDPYVIENRSPYGANLELRNSAGTTVGYIPISQIATVQLINKSTSAGEWAVELIGAPQQFFKYDSASITTVTTTPVPTQGSTTNGYGMVGLTATTFVRWWAVQAGGIHYLYTQVGTISGSTITFGSIQNTGVVTFLTQSDNVKVIRLSNTAFAVLFNIYGTTTACCGTSISSCQRIFVCTVSGTTVTFGTPSAASTPSTSILNQPGNSALSVLYNGTICRLSDTSFALFYNDNVNNSYSFPYGYSGSMSCQIVTVSGTTMTIGTKVNLGTSTYTQVLSAVALSSTSVFLCYAQATAAGGSTGRTKMVVVSVSGTVPTFNTPVNCESADTTVFQGGYSGSYVDGAVAPSATQVIFNTGYALGEATVSGTVPTFDSFPYNSLLFPLFLSTSSKAWSGGGVVSVKGYLSVATGGFVPNTNVKDVLQTNLSVTSANPWTPLGAQPTTAYVAYKNASGYSASSTVVLGTTS